MKYTVDDIFKVMGRYWIAYDEEVFKYPTDPNKRYTCSTSNTMLCELSYRTTRTEILVAALRVANF